LAAFGGMMPPDPNVFLKLLWPHLDINTQNLIRALLSQPGQAAAGGQAAPAVDPKRAAGAEPLPIGQGLIDQKLLPSGAKYAGMSADGRYHQYEAVGGMNTVDTQTGVVQNPQGGTYGGAQAKGAQTLDPKVASTSGRQNVSDAQQGNKVATVGLHDGRQIEIF
jgi:hypothetical protein